MNSDFPVTVEIDRDLAFLRVGRAYVTGAVVQLGGDHVEALENGGDPHVVAAGLLGELLIAATRHAELP